MTGARKCALALGILFTLLGIAGFIPSLVSLPGDIANSAAPITMAQVPRTEGPNYLAAYLRGFGYLFGLFPTNTLHNILHLTIGAIGIVSSLGDRGTFNYNRFFAIAYTSLAVFGLLPVTKTLFGIMPIFGNNVWLNAITGAVAAYFTLLLYQNRELPGPQEQKIQ